MSVNNHLMQPLSSNGDGTGTVNINGNYASATDFYIQPPDKVIYSITNLLVNIQDSGAFDVAKYGNGIVLTNGILCRIMIGSTVIVNLTNNFPIIHNGDWGHFTSELIYRDFGVGDKVLQVYIDFIKTFTKPIILDGSLNEKLVLTFQDNFTGLTEHSIHAHGLMG